jgi:Holliday junction resolvase RusA-like endonuclease
MLTIVVRGRPAPQGSKRARPVYKGGQFTGVVAQQEMSPHVKSWREDVKTAAEDAIEASSHVRIEGPVRVRMVFTIEKPKSRPKTRRTYPDTMPDLSKLCRSTEDALTAAGVWRDDARVVEYTRLAKVYANEDSEAMEVPGVRIQVESVLEDPAPPFGELVEALHAG